MNYCIVTKDCTAKNCRFGCEKYEGFMTEIAEMEFEIKE